MKKAVILLTGTVNPSQMLYTKLSDPAIRKAQYLTSLNYWLRKTTLPIIFVENSGVNLSKEIDQAYSSRIEFLTFQGNDYPKELGKGYGELKCFEYAFANSIFLKTADFVFKITGRLKVLNFDRLYNHFLKNETPFVLLDFKRSLTFADSRFFGFQPDFFSYYLFKHDEVNDSNHVYFEHILATSTLEAIIDKKNFKQLSLYPQFQGHSGTDNQPYKSNPIYFLMKKVQFLLKALFINK